MKSDKKVLQKINKTANHFIRFMKNDKEAFYLNVVVIDFPCQPTDYTGQWQPIPKCLSELT